MVTIDRERLINQKQNNKASPEGARLPKEAMLLRDIFKFTKPSLDAFRPFGLISRAFQGSRAPPNSINVSGESRKFFLPVLCMPEAHNSSGSKIIFLWLLIKKGKWVLDIH